MKTCRILRSRRGAVLNILDVVVVAGILAFAAVVAIPGYQRESLRERARVVKQDLQAIEEAVNEAAKKMKLESGQSLGFDDYRPYLRRKPLKDTGKDPFGNPYGEQAADTRPRLSRDLHARFAAVVPDGFWGPYLPAAAAPPAEEPAPAPGDEDDSETGGKHAGAADAPPGAQEEKSKDE